MSDTKHARKVCHDTVPGPVKLGHSVAPAQPLQQPATLESDT